MVQSPLAPARSQRTRHRSKREGGLSRRHEETLSMAKLRHIAIAVKDPEAAATFFEQAFGMTRAGNAMRGVYMTDGIMNVALLNFAEEPVAGMEGQKNVTGLIHFGMWVDSVEEIDKAITAAGGSYVTGRKETGPNVY